MTKTAARLIALPAIADLDRLDEVRDGLIAAIEAGPVRVSGAAVERVSTNALLMLLSAAETARRNGVGFEVGQASAAMQAAIDRLGLGEPFAAMTKG